MNSLYVLCRPRTEPICTVFLKLDKHPFIYLQVFTHLVVWLSHIPPSVSVLTFTAYLQSSIKYIFGFKSHEQRPQLKNHFLCL